MEYDHSERAQYVTNQVELWICNDGEHYHEARSIARFRPQDLMAVLTHLIRTAPYGSAAWHVSQALAPNDYERINWRDVADALIGE